MEKSIYTLVLFILLSLLFITGCQKAKMTAEERMLYLLDQKETKELVEYSLTKQDKQMVLGAQKIILNRAIKAMDTQEVQFQVVVDQFQQLDQKKKENEKALNDQEKLKWYQLLDKKRDKYKEILKNYKNIACLAIHQSIDTSTTLGKKATAEVPCSVNHPEQCPHHCRGNRLPFEFHQPQYEKVAQRHDTLLIEYLKDQSLFNLNQAVVSIHNAEQYISDCLSCDQKQAYQAEICLKMNEDGLDLLALVQTQELRAWLDRCEGVKDKRVQALIAYRNAMLTPLAEFKWHPALDDLPEYLSFFAKFRLAEKEAYEIIKESDQIERFIKNEYLRQQQISKINRFTAQYQLQKERLGALWDGLLIRHDELLIPALIQSSLQSPTITNTLARRQSLDYLLHCQKCTHAAKISEFFEKSAFQLTQIWTTAPTKEGLGASLFLEDALWLVKEGKLERLGFHELRGVDPYFKGLALKDQPLFMLKNTRLSGFTDLTESPKILQSAKQIWVKTKQQIRIFDELGIFKGSRVLEQDIDGKVDPCLHFIAIAQGVACLGSDLKLLLLYGENQEKKQQGFEGMTIRYLDEQYAIFQDQQKLVIYPFVNGQMYRLSFALQSNAQIKVNGHKLWVYQDQKLSVYDLKTKQKKWEYADQIDQFFVYLLSENEGKIYLLHQNQLKALNVSDAKLEFKINLGLKGQGLVLLDQIGDRLLLKQNQSIFFVDEGGNIRHELKQISDFKYAPFSLNQFMLYDQSGQIQIYDTKTYQISWQAKILAFDEIEVKASQILTRFKNRLSLYELTLGQDQSEEAWKLKALIKAHYSAQKAEELLAQKKLFAPCMISQWDQCHEVFEQTQLFDDAFKQKRYEELCQMGEPKACYHHARSIAQAEPQKALTIAYESCHTGEADACVFFADQMQKKGNVTLAQLGLSLAVSFNHLPSKLKLAHQLYQLPENEQSITKAISLFQELCEEKQAEACFQMSKLYQKKELWDKANLYLLDACRYGYQEACEMKNKDQ